MIGRPTMGPDRSKLVIGKDGIASCPDCTRETFELHDPGDAMNDAAVFALRKVEGGFERKDPLGGLSSMTNWHAESRRVGCINCRRRGPWIAYALSADGTRVE
ncbi:MAG: hypothetical protein IT348_17735 [Candidatus Eisenbacteria bacterium]|nr:hypothetical protein [Candidatus Eisenbacteria bacterium]